MKVLQLASFSGNIGDNAHVAGLRNTLRQHLGSGLAFHDLEIRRFYKSWNEARFDRSFAEYANQHDALIIGGGGFFDMNFPYSVTGTTIDLSSKILDAIKVPIVFHGLGCNQLRDPDPECANKFRTFLDRILAKDKCLVSVRNDGSHEIIENHVGSAYAKQIHEIPDPGFFFQLDEAYTNTFKTLLKKDARYIAICLAGDEAQARYGDPVRFPEKMGKSLQRLLDVYDDLNLIFFPHIFQDLETIYNILGHLPDQTRRLRTQVAPCFQGANAEQYIFSLYSQCDIVVSNRLHGIVVPVSLGIASVAFCDNATRKVPRLIEKIDLADYKYLYTEDLDGFHDTVCDTLAKSTTFKKRSAVLLESLTIVNDRFIEKFKAIL